MASIPSPLTSAWQRRLHTSVRLPDSSAVLGVFKAWLGSTPGFRAGQALGPSGLMPLSNAALPEDTRRMAGTRTSVLSSKLGNP